MIRNLRKKNAEVYPILLVWQQGTSLRLNTLTAEQKLFAHSALPAADAYYYEKKSTANGDTYRYCSSGC